LAQSIDLIELIRLLWQRKIILIFFALIIGILALLISLVLPKKYEAHTSIIIAEDASAKALTGFTVKAFGLAGLDVPKESTAAYTEILQSRRVFTNVIDKLNLRDYYKFPEDRSEDLRLIKEMEERLTLDPIRNSVLHLKYIDHNPKTASDIANAFIDELSKYLKTGASNKSVLTRDFINDQITDIQKKLQSSEEAFKDYLAKEDAAGIDEQIIQMVRKSADVQAMKTTDEVSLQLTKKSIESEKKLKNILGKKSTELSGEYKQYEDKWKEPGNLLSMSQVSSSDLSDMPGEILVDSAVTQLRKSLAEVKIKLLDEQITKTPQHPAVVKLNNEIFNLRSLFIDEVSGVMDSRLASLEFERLSLEAQISAYDTVLAQMDSMWSGLPDKSMQFVRLKRDVEALSQAYLLLQGQLMDANIAAVRDSEYFDILDIAVPPEKPVSPKPLIATIVGIILGLVLGIGWIYYDAVLQLRKREEGNG
jgi:succinoglycan biosynthesis transport protein ExoP